MTNQSYFGRKISRIRTVNVYASAIAGHETKAYLKIQEGLLQSLSSRDADFDVSAWNGLVFGDRISNDC